ncbi:hypothetical protein Pan258_06200 [Symmachiella dynata]|uniref:Uncharacterized protein n=1 Tax=Symmachiella dynata TaxID=2527995 RepID=A0A517ZI30_9PLAN|nr:hypothetical protein [Symmachiella dynata]QDT46601.1 hypothetical protein Pan258_06200 [Symmachiella dynata]QDU42112.1 hypothetical protein Mal52_05670 [Symmachiella dynata]
MHQLFELPLNFVSLNALGGIAAFFVCLSFGTLVYTVVQLSRRPVRLPSFAVYLFSLLLATIIGGEMFFDEAGAVYFVAWLWAWSFLCFLEALIREYEPIDFLAPLCTIFLTLAYWTLYLFVLILISL